MEKPNLTNALGTISLIGGILYAMKNNKGLGVTALYGLGFGIAGMFIGNQLQKAF